MTTPMPVPPTWVRKRDGRLVPFEADRISRALFAAAEDCGRPDAFLARELADVVLHFLSDEADGGAPTTGQVAETVVKVLRELKQHDLAAAFEEHARGKARGPRLAVRGDGGPAGEGVFRYLLHEAPSAVRRECLRDYSLRAIYTRDLAAAHRDGLVSLSGLDAPGELGAAVLGPPSGTGRKPRAAGRPWPGLLEELSDFPGRVVVLDGVEHALARAAPGGAAARRPAPAWADRAASAFLDELSLGLRLTGRAAVVNLNSASGPPWAEGTAAGPLFAEQDRPAEMGWRAALADAVAETALEPGTTHPHVRVDWHLAEPDFAPDAADRLLRLARAALGGAAVVFVFDRPRRPLSLAEGVERRHPAVLLGAGLHLTRLATLVVEGPGRLSTAEHDEAGTAARGERLLGRLGSLARLALSAALQKREFLRRHSRECPALARGFLIERARLVVAPVGLAEAVEAVLGRGLSSSPEALELGCAILRRLREVLRDEGRASALEVCLDAPPSDGEPSTGPTGWDGTAPVREQLRAIGALHEAAGGGTGAAFLPADAMPSPEEVAGWLRWAWKETGALRLRLVRSQLRQRQLTFPVPEER